MPGPPGLFLCTPAVVVPEQGVSGGLEHSCFFKCPSLKGRVVERGQCPRAMLDYLKYQKAREDSGVGDGGILKQFFPSCERSKSLETVFDFWHST